MEEFLFELHMHTDEVSPCGKIPAREGIRIYHELGYKGVCITDHFYWGFFECLGDIPWKDKVDAYLRGYREAQDEGKKLGIKVILGMEFAFPNTSDDILIYGFDEKFLYDHENLYLSGEAELQSLKKEYNLLFIQAHPFRKKISKIYKNLVDGYEVFNGNARHNSMNPQVEEFAGYFGCIMISGSDFHQLEDSGTGGVYLSRIPKDSCDLAYILREEKAPRLNRNDRTGNGI